MQYRYRLGYCCRRSGRLDVLAKGRGAELSTFLRGSDLQFSDPSGLGSLPWVSRVQAEDRNIDLVAEGVDVALRMGPLTDPNMTVRKIERRRLVMATPEYFERYGKPEAPGELIGHQAVIYTRNNGGEDLTFTRNTEQTSIGLSGRVRISATEGLRAAVLAGVDLTVASEFAFSPE